MKYKLLKFTSGICFTNTCKYCGTAQQYHHCERNMKSPITGYCGVTYWHYGRNLYFLGDVKVVCGSLSCDVSTSL